MTTTPTTTMMMFSSSITESKQRTQRNTRYAAVDFLQHAGELLLIPQTVIATSIIFYHKFTKFISDEQIPDDRYDKYHIACSCVFIACKCQENLRSLRDICNVLQRIRYPQRANFTLHCPELAKLKQIISMHEQIVLRALAYNVRIIVPYSYVGPYLKCLNFGPNSNNSNSGHDTTATTINDHSRGNDGNDDSHGGDVDAIRDLQLKQLLQCTCSLLNDSLRTDLCITYKSHEIAVGCIYLAAKLCDITLPYHPSRSRTGTRTHEEENDERMEMDRTEQVDMENEIKNGSSSTTIATTGTTTTEREWYHLFNVSRETLRGISNEMIQLYSDYKQC